jgi:hypothetical protein
VIAPYWGNSDAYPERRLSWRNIRQYAAYNSRREYDQ